MSTKFKIGDRVTCINAVTGNKKIINQKGTIVNISSSSLPLGIEFDNPIHNNENCNTKLKKYHGWYVNYSDVVLIKCEKIVIYRKGNEVIAKDCNTGKLGVAKCAPRDEFDFSVGAKLALERLTGKVTFKMLCVCDKWDFRKGKIYEAIDGRFTYENGRKSCKYASFKDFIDDNRCFKNNLIELKDGDDVNEILKRYDNIKKGDKVKVISPGKTYTTYSPWKGLKGYESHFVPKKLPDNGKTYRVLNVQKHDVFGHLIALIQDEDTTQVFIIDVVGLEKE